MELRIKDICDINLSTISSGDRFDYIKYLDTSNLTENEINCLQSYSLSEAPSRAQRKVRHATILYSSVRPNQKHYGIITTPEENLIVSTGFITLDVKKEKANDIDAFYLYYLLTQDWVTFYLQTIAENTVSAYPSITPNDLGNLKFDFPLINVQRQISSFLGNIEHKIVLSKSINRNLEALAKQIYDYWFVQFDFPNEEGKPYKSSGGKMVWNETLKRDVPQGWEVLNIFDVADVLYGYPFSTDCFVEKPTQKPVVRIRDIVDNTSSAYTTENVDELYRLNEGDLVIGMDGNFHMNYWHDNKCYLNQRCVRFRDIPEVPISTMQLFFNIKPILDHKQGLIQGSTVGHLLDSDIKEFWIVCPPPEKRKYIKTQFDNILKAITENKKEIFILNNLRNYLLPLLMNGQVTIKD